MSNKNNTFNDYLKKFITEKGQKYTHTRIGNRDLKIMGACYNISDEELNNFYKKYYQHVFENDNLEYLTEKQSIENSPITDRYRYEI